MLFYYGLFSFLLTANLINIVSSNDGENIGECMLNKKTECGVSGDVNDLDNKLLEEPSAFYTKASNDILRSIKDALSSYEPCADKEDDACSCHANTIAKDLEPFRTEGISKELIALSAKYGTRYKILNKKLYREERCMFPARCSGIEHFIQPLLARLRDMDLVINTRDWPQKRSDFGLQLPVFSFSKTQDYCDIMYPAWSFWAGGPAIALHPTGIGRWDLQRDKISRAGKALPWDKKLAKGFFRGSRTSDERDSLVLLSRRQPELVDAKYTKNQAWKSHEDTLHDEPAQEVSFEAHCNYKYLFNFRGVAASFRLKHLFLCKSLVFHVGNEWNEFYYFAMKPWVHYVPLSSYPSEQEIESMLHFFQKNDDLAQQIAERGFQFIWEHLRMKDVECYWERLLTEYQKLIEYKVEPEDDLLEKL